MAFRTTLLLSAALVCQVLITTASGAEALNVHRSIKFDYNIPSGQDAISSRDQIDFSGYSFTGFLNYNF